MEAKKPITARKLTPIELKMLDVGAPIVVSCETITGESVAIRLQTANLSAGPESGEAAGYWLSHGAYVAVMPEGNWE
jgi:hypothetical protein